MEQAILHGLKGEEIPYLVRITSIADSFDAMSSRRSYRNQLTLDTIINEFEKNKGTQFDPKLTDVFLDILKNHFDEIKEIQNEQNDIKSNLNDFESIKGNI